MDLVRLSGGLLVNNRFFLPIGYILVTFHHPLTVIPTFLLSQLIELYNACYLLN
jgi:hypothetical protein